MKSFIFSCLCLLIFWLPIPLGSYRPWALMLLTVMVSSVFLCHLWLAFKEERPLFPPRISVYILGPLALVMLVLTIQLVPGLNPSSNPLNSLTSISIDPSQTQVMLLKTLCYFLFAWLVFSYVTTATKLRQICYVVVAAGLFQALYATYLNLQPNITSPLFGFRHHERAIGSFTYSNFLANYLALCLALGIGVLISQLSLNSSGSQFKAKLRDMITILLSSKMLLRLSLIAMIIALILTRSRMGNSAFFIALAAVSLFAFFFYDRKPRYLRTLIISFFVLDLIIVGAMFGVEKVKERLVETSLQSETRDEVIEDSIPLLKDNVWLGTGGGSFYTAFPAYQSGPYSGFYDNAHNDYLQFAIELGVPTTALLGLMMLFALYKSIQTMVKRKTPLYQGVAFGCTVAILHMLLHSTVDYSLQAGANAMTFIIILCLALISSALPSGKRSRGYK
ncbi:O-antigen ligase family protein [Pseudoalteromonas tunicata]|uniref:O-antigen ligase family protein n=1 Tax=Pseudoalteromonas tunicata TaxID=314281 RepID=UPI00273E0DB0|nr:O-antigen ligase family protein [Pseudoalteromonas tunicata]MDP5211608.1 O-antigen ligase family protein [Pseudoalteromonas tunicata]